MRLKMQHMHIARVSFDPEEWIIISSWQDVVTHHSAFPPFLDIWVKWWRKSPFFPSAVCVVCATCFMEIFGNICFCLLLKDQIRHWWFAVACSMKQEMFFSFFFRNDLAILHAYCIDESLEGLVVQKIVNITLSFYCKLIVILPYNCHISYGWKTVKWHSQKFLHDTSHMIYFNSFGSSNFLLSVMYSRVFLW